MHTCPRKLVHTHNHTHTHTHSKYPAATRHPSDLFLKKKVLQNLNKCFEKINSLKENFLQSKNKYCWYVQLIVPLYTALQVSIRYTVSLKYRHTINCSVFTFSCLRWVTCYVGRCERTQQAKPWNLFFKIKGVTISSWHFHLFKNIQIFNGRAQRSAASAVRSFTVEHIFLLFMCCFRLNSIANSNTLPLVHKTLQLFSRRVESTKKLEKSKINQSHCFLFTCDILAPSERTAFQCNTFASLKKSFFFIQTFQNLQTITKSSIITTYF